MFHYNMQGSLVSAGDIPKYSLVNNDNSVAVTFARRWMTFSPRFLNTVFTRRTCADFLQP